MTDTPEKKSTSNDPHKAAFLIGPNGWQPIDEDKDIDELRSRLSQRFLDRNLVILVGSGASIGVGGPSMGSFWEFASSHKDFEHALNKTNHARDDKNIESFLSRCRMAQEFEKVDKKLDHLVLEIQRHIVDKCCNFLNDSTQLADHIRFLQKFGCRSVDLSRPLVFTTNYDLCIETAASRAAIPVIDGFSFTFPRRFDGGNYQLDYVRKLPGRADLILAEGVFHLYKLHGSVSWSTVGTEVEQDYAKRGDCLIFPRDSKFKLSFQHPFLEMMARFQFALREPNTTLITIGYGFNDDHLSEPILNSLRTNPNFNLVVATRSLQKHTTGAKANKHLSVLSKLASSPGVANISLLDCEFSQLVPLLPNVVVSTEHERFKDLLRSALLLSEF
jgi:hypothetical protein